MAIRCKITGKHKMQPGENGSCPECTTVGVPLTQKGFVGAHDVKVDLGEGPEIPVTDEGTRVGDPRDAAVRREVDANKVRAGKQAMPEGGVADPVITTGHNRGAAMYRGRAMRPMATKVVTYPKNEERPEPAAPLDTRTGFAASAGTMYGPTGRERTEREEYVGGAYGWLTQGQYRKLSRTQQRKYWDKIHKRRTFTAQRRKAAQAGRVSVEDEVKRLRAVGNA